MSEASTSTASTTGAGGRAALVRSSGVMAAGTAVSRLTGFARTVVLIAALGTAATANTYNVAHSLPTAIYILIAGGVLNAVFVPQLVRAMKEQPDGGKGYADRLLTLTGLVLLVVTVLATLAAPLVAALYFRGPPDDYAVAVAFAYWALPQIFFYGAFTVLAQVLNARGRFGPMMWAPILANAVTIACGLVFIALVGDAVDPQEPQTVPGWGVALLGGGATLGVVLQTAALLPALRRSGYRFTPRFDFRGFGLGRAARLAKWTLLFVAVNQLGFLVVSNVGTAVDSEAKTLLGYGVGLTAYQSAYMVFLLPHAIITVSVVTALLPRMSRAAVEGRTEEMRGDLVGGLRVSAVAVVPAAVAFAVLGRDIAGALYAPAGPAAAHYIGWVLTGFAPGLLAFTGHYLALRGFYAQEDTRTPFLVNVCINAVNVALVLLAYAVLRPEWVGVAMAGSYSVSYGVGMLLSLRLLRRRTGPLEGAQTLRTYARLLAAALVAAVPAFLAARAATAGLGEGLLGSLAGTVAGGLVLLAGYVLLAQRMRVPELTSVVALVRTRRSR